jgi:hypothetical protein
MVILKDCFYIFWLLFFSSLSGGCGSGFDIEESAIITDNEDRNELVEMFNEMSIEHRVEGDRIWYSIRDRDKVSSAKKRVWPELRYLGHVVVFAEEEKAVGFSNHLSSQGFESDVIRYGEDYAVGWERRNDAAIRMLYDSWEER